MPAVTKRLQNAAMGIIPYWDAADLRPPFFPAALRRLPAMNGHSKTSSSCHGRDPIGALLNERFSA